MELSAEQLDGLAVISDWWDDPRAPQVLTIAGYAGTGKSSLIDYAIDALEIPRDKVGFVAYTGKAALVLRTKGCDASTIHRLIFEPLLSSYTDPVTKLKKTRVAGFRQRERLERDLKLIVLDECSMVSKELLNQLMVYRTRILALGDPAQLPPVMGKDNGLLIKPAVFLKNIHRQAGDNPIVWASMLARSGKKIPYGKHGENLLVIPRARTTMDVLIAANQVLCCTNQVRRAYNMRMREALGQTTQLPNVGEKLVCRKNDYEQISNGVPLVNGMVCRNLREVKEQHVNYEDRTVFLNVAALDLPGTNYWGLESNLDFFIPIEGRSPDTDDGKIQHFDWGYALSVHRSQGSEFRNVTFYADLFGDQELQRQLLYTGVTRASEYLTLAI